MINPKKVKKVISPMDIACFRFGTIAPVIQGTFPDASEAAYYRRVTQESFTLPDGSTFQYSPDTLERWTGLYRKYGMDGLIPKTRKDKGESRSIDAEAAAEISRLFSEHPGTNGVAVHDSLIRNGFIPATVSVRAVQRFIRENNLKKPQEGSVRERRAFEMERFGQLWQADTAYLPYITDESGKSRRTYVIMIIDDHSRMIVGGEIFYNDNALNFQKVLKDAITSYGIPDKIYTDHGSSFENEQLSFILGSLGIAESHAPVRDGAAKGKIERNFRTLRSRWLSIMDVSKIHSLAQFNSMLSDYIREHNRTFHTGINGTPMERYLNTKNYIRIPRSREWLDESFYNRISRKVRKDSVVKINETEYDVPARFAGLYVDIRYNPGHMKDAFLLYNGERFPLQLTDRVANSSLRRNNPPLTIDYSGKGGTV